MRHQRVGIQSAVAFGASQSVANTGVTRNGTVIKDDGGAHRVREKILVKAHATGYPLQGRRKFRGLEISIEQRKGGVRSGVDADGKPWRVKMTAPYGYIRRTESSADHDHIDCFIGPHEDAPSVYIININNPKTGKFDEQKCFLGFKSAAHAKRVFAQNYTQPEKFFRSLQTMPYEEFERKVLATLPQGGGLVKAHVRGYQRKDGTLVREHEDKRPSAVAIDPVLLGKPNPVGLSPVRPNVDARRYETPVPSPVGAAPTWRDVTTHKRDGTKTEAVGHLRISATSFHPERKTPSLLVDLENRYGATPSTYGSEIKTNMFRSGAGWKWVEGEKPPLCEVEERRKKRVGGQVQTHPESGLPLWERTGRKHEAIISVEQSGKHFYALDFHTGAVSSHLREVNADTNPFLRPSAKGRLVLGPIAGYIEVRGVRHPVYSHIHVEHLHSNKESAHPRLASPEEFMKSWSFSGALTKAHVHAYTRSDGTLVREHEDSRAPSGSASADGVSAPAPSAPATSPLDLLRNHPMFQDFARHIESSPFARRFEPETTTATESSPHVHSSGFKNWFGDWQNDPQNASKVVQKSGEPQSAHPLHDDAPHPKHLAPMTLYHGTKSSFDEFDPARLGSGGGQVQGPGYYFSECPRDAKNYGNHLLKVHLNIRKPFDLDGHEGFRYDKDAMERYYASGKALYPEKQGAVMRYFGHGREHHPVTDSHKMGSAVHDVMRAHGYDGYKYRFGFLEKGQDATRWVAFHPHQIKHVDNDGTFNPHSGNIFKSRILVQRSFDGAPLPQVFR